LRTFLHHEKSKPSEWVILTHFGPTNSCNGPTNS
jgi:hypothetical protein